MNPELETFYQSQLPWRTLDQKLTPIFNHIRMRNINCVSQLQTQKNEEIDSFSPPSKTLPVFYDKKIKNERQEINRVRKIFQVPPVRMAKRMVLTLEVKQNEKIMFVSPNSKIKKHLVESIDYIGIEESLFQKKERVTKFDDFCRTLRQKERWVTLKPSSLGKDIDEEFQKITINPFGTVRDDRKNPFRISRKQHSPIAKRLENIIKKQSLSRQSQI